MRKGRTARDVPPPLELECLRALWVLKEANVQAIRDYLAPRRPLAYTTVMTMLERLTRKQMLTRRKVSRAFLYTPALTRNEARRRFLDEITETLFDGDTAQLLDFIQNPPPPNPEPAAEPAQPAPETGAPLETAATAEGGTKAAAATAPETGAPDSDEERLDTSLL